jgi:cytoskeletal protein CcmA (bactofilin family)
MPRPMMSVFGQVGQRSRAPAQDDAAASREASAAPQLVEESRKPGKQLVTTLGKTLFFKGGLLADEDVILLGRVEGTITHTGNLTIGVGGIVIGDVTARTLTVKGTIEGDVDASESVVVALSGVVRGEIKTPRISIVEGAECNGAIVMVKKPQVQLESAAVLDDAIVMELLSGG